MTRDSTRGWCAIGETTASNKHRFSRFSYQGRKRGAASFFAIFSDDFVPTQSSAIYEARGPVQARTQISSMALNLKQQKTTAGRRGKDERRNNRRDKEREVEGRKAKCLPPRYSPGNATMKTRGNRAELIDPLRITISPLRKEGGRRERTGGVVGHL